MLADHGSVEVRCLRIHSSWDESDPSAYSSVCLSGVLDVILELLVLAEEVLDLLIESLLSIYRVVFLVQQERLLLLPLRTLLLERKQLLSLLSLG